ncbi:hypothetical protein A2917_01040 [Candidatus Nomurabacteria bacterium RIFCSPLOWO2_01_FULL_42_17]|uniref:RNA polymerase sigma factor n=1 Tax=Candidatus Nomurabacteria bacterium RIFCSPLOWO2_01_FULL_42_17 TaxID=1801780 RepID=A0A1F6XMG7_9BACT|nr:MAG: hypothetical protein A2917_01040 [Candidatus Nomurabacteria bacterium RIFCSPLOWO2_01_FULL_42_17]
MRTNLNQLFETAYRDESDAIFRFCLVRVSDRDQALEIMQETFLRFWQSLSLQQEILNKRAFLFTIARYLIIDWYRKKKSFSLDRMNENKKEMYDLIDEKTTEDIPFNAEGRYLIERIDELAASYRDPVYLRFVECLSPVEIGDVLGISANTASVRINRGLLKLRKRAGYDYIY